MELSHDCIAPRHNVSSLSLKRRARQLAHRTKSAFAKASRLRARLSVNVLQRSIVCSRPPPAPSSGTRRPTVRSQSLATLQRIVCSYLLPGRWLLRSFLTVQRQRSGRRASTRHQSEA